MEDDNHKKRKRDGDTTDDSSDKPLLELLSAWFCPYAQRAWMAMEIKCPGQFKVTEALKITSPDGVYSKDSLSRIPLLKESNPSGLVPTIIDRRGDKPVSVYDSLICVEYIDEVFHDNGTTQLLPGGPFQRAEARMWSNRLNNDIVTTFYMLLLNQNKVEQDKAANKMLGAVLDFCQNCKGPFFYGDEISIVDLTIAPWLVGAKMEGVLKPYRNFEIPKTSEYSKYYEWRDSMLKHPAFVATASTYFEATKRVYSRYADGTALIMKNEET
jgi:glutathione S-transferase